MEMRFKTEDSLPTPNHQLGSSSPAWCGVPPVYVRWHVHCYAATFQGRTNRPSPAISGENMKRILMGLVLAFSFTALAGEPAKAEEKKAEAPAPAAEAKPADAKAPEVKPAAATTPSKKKKASAKDAAA